MGAQGLYTRWPGLPFEERRRVVETIVKRIVVGSGEVEINLFYAPPAPVRRHVVVTALILKAPKEAPSMDACTPLSPPIHPPS